VCSEKRYQCSSSPWPYCWRHEYLLLPLIKGHFSHDRMSTEFSASTSPLNWSRPMIWARSHVERSTHFTIMVKLTVSHVPAILRPRFHISWSLLESLFPFRPPASERPETNRFKSWSWCKTYILAAELNCFQDTGGSKVSKRNISSYAFSGLTVRFAAVMIVIFCNGMWRPIKAHVLIIFLVHLHIYSLWIKYLNQFAGWCCSQPTTAENWTDVPYYTVEPLFTYSIGQKWLYLLQKVLKSRYGFA
jgi:hypothetical protein